MGVGCCWETLGQQLMRTETRMNWWLNSGLIREEIGAIKGLFGAGAKGCL